MIASKYNCPKCDKPHNDWDLIYIVNGVEYPKRYNHSTGHTLDGNYHDWKETHCCEDCETEFSFINGAY